MQADPIPFIATGELAPFDAPAHDANRDDKRGEELRIDLLSRSIPAVETDDGIRAVAGEKAISHDAVESYLVRSFGDGLADVRSAMKSLAKSFMKDELAAAAYGLYEQFRPSIPSGVRGWGAKGELDLKLIRSLEQ